MSENDLQQTVRRILVFRIGELGDTLIALPSLRAIRLAFPQAHLILLGNADVAGRYVTPNQVLPSKGLVDEWVSYPSADRRPSILNSIGLLRRLRRLGCDTLAYLAPRIRSARDVRRDLLFFRMAGIRNVIADRGFELLPRSIPGTPLMSVEHEADHLLRRLSLSGISVPAAGRAKIELALTEEERRKADEWLHQNLAAFCLGELVGFGPGSKWPSKVWPEDRFAEVGRRLIAEHNIYPIVFGGPEDRALGERLVTGWGRGTNAAGDLPVRHTAAALARCRLYVGNDTGTMHLAASVGSPCVAIMAAQDWPGHWTPYGTGHTVLRRTVPCEGCLLQVCEREGMRCLTEITVEEVVGACAGVLSAKSKAQSAESMLSA